MKKSIPQLRAIYILLAIMLIAPLSSLKSQNMNTANLAQLKQQPLQGFFGLTLTNCVPQNEFFSNTRRTGFGFSLQGGYHADPLPFAFGADIDFIFFGSNERHGWYEWVDPIGNHLLVYDTTTTSNSIIPFNIFFRIQPNIMNWVVPYVEAFGGFTVLSLSTEYKSSDHNNYSYNSSKSKVSATWNYGASAGIMVKIVDFVQPKTNYLSTLNVDVKAKYIYGGEASYWKAVFNKENQLDLSETKTKTDMLLVMVGVSFRF